jgi:uncharacterized membrane protein
MEPKLVSIGKGLSWIGDGWKIFKNDVGMWLVLTIVYLIAVIIISMIPFLGQLIVSLINPVLMGGLLYAASDSARGEKITFNHLIYAFMEPEARNKTLVLGAISIVFTILCMIILFFVVGGGALMGILTGSLSQNDGAGALVGAGMFGMGLIFAVLFIMLIGIIYFAAVYFALPLVVFTDISPFEAFAKSISACLKNALPLLVYGIVVTVLAVIAMIPLGLGLILLFPILMGAYYASYSDIFGPNETHYVQ